MDCTYTTQGEFVCKKIENVDRNSLFVLQDQCKFIKSNTNNSYEDAYKYENCPKTCEYNGMMYDGNWTHDMCRCCKQ